MSAYARGGNKMGNDTTLNDFFRILAAPVPPAERNSNADADYLMTNVFCPDSPDHYYPCVGITEHLRPVGPAFFGAANVRVLLVQLFTTFPDLALTSLPGEPRLYSHCSFSPKTIGVQTTLVGTHKAKWFQKPHPAHSLPLSAIEVSNKKVEIPAFAVFTFDNNDRICQLAIYLDRYKFMTQLTGDDNS